MRQAGKYQQGFISQQINFQHISPALPQKPAVRRHRLSINKEYL